MKHTLWTLSPPARIYVVAVILAGAGIWAASVSDLVRNPVGLEWLVLVALTVGSSWATLRIPGWPINFSISDIFTIAAALLFGPSAGAITAAVDGLVLSARMDTGQRSVDRVLFNMAAVSIALWVAAQVFFAIGGNQPQLDGPLDSLRLLMTLLVFGLIDFTLNSGIVAVAVSFQRRVAIVSIWRAHLAGVWINYFGGIFGAMLVMLLARFSTLETLILIVPLPVLLYVTFRHALGRATDQIDNLAKMNRVYIGAIEALAHAVDAKDQVTHDHTRRVQDQTLRLARALAVDDEGELQAIKAAALLHDVGKLAIPEHILNKPGRLTPAEYEIMKRHAPIGADILSVIGFPYAVAPIVRHHHENWDGTGYPDGIVGEAIPIGSRILAVVDCFDALTSDRPYRPRMEDRDALQILSDRRGNMYDPHVVDAFFALHAKGAIAEPASDEVLSPVSTAVPVPSSSSGSSASSAEPVEEVLEESDLQTFFGLGQSLASAVSVEHLGEALWMHLGKRLPASAFVLFGYDAESDAIVAVYTAGRPRASRLVSAPVALGDRLSGWVAATGQTVMNSDARLDLDDNVREASTLRSALAVRVVTTTGSSGVLSFYAEASNAFEESHRRLVEGAARALAGSAVSLSPEPAASAFRNDTRVFRNTKAT
jgi:putative nucleotidyltransferase with HDIG domain